MDEYNKTNQANIVVWPAPQGISASNEETKETRARHYLATTKTTLSNGTNILPNSETVELILQAWDNFGLQVIVNENSYLTINN